MLNDGPLAIWWFPYFACFTPCFNDLTFCWCWSRACCSLTFFFPHRKALTFLAASSTSRAHYIVQVKYYISVIIIILSVTSKRLVMANVD